ncbi:RHS repeat-associated core domain-containing protein [Anaerocolumna jejuensis DSM 15929]|uniref:RHS repeat-associated core domain-containing protein n=1 Tax=Anaerocolumna jejuensis DSM 15929 TaxID=1121322 RepID=A0A1M7DQB1_9FIRM|nr:RHS repeat-associated core domain-containing protein [Anaerocolumna jejuensis DSM 15929]
MKGSEPPNGLITWVFQDDFIPRAKLTKNDAYSIISDYLGTPVEAYDEEGKKVWERELDIYGRVKTRLKDKYGRSTDFVGEDGFIPFRYQGQYEDVETGLYYNRFRYYNPEIGQYTQQDPVGLAGGNPTIYGYVGDPNGWLDPFGLTNWSDVLRNLGVEQPQGLTNPHGHHIVFKGEFKNSPIMRGIIKKSREILGNFDIEINDSSNLMWASNGNGTHTIVNAKKVNIALSEAQDDILKKVAEGSISHEQAQAMMKEKLQETGQKVFGNCK